MTLSAGICCGRAVRGRYAVRAVGTRNTLGRRRARDLRVNHELYLYMIPALAYYLLFHYYPMYGVQIAFRDYIPTRGFLGSKWVGLEHLLRFFNSYHFWGLIRNTLGISLYQLAAGFPAPILLALMLNEVRHTEFKRFAQTVTYAPHFISTVVLVGLLMIFLSPTTGLVNQLVVLLGGTAVDYLARPQWFKTLYVLSGIWQQTGWSTIIYLAVLASVDPGLYEAARIDGASKLQKILHIDIPSILPTAIILLILSSGQIMNVGFEKVYLMQRPINQSVSEILSTFVYKVGLNNMDYSFSTAINLFNSVVNLVLLLTVNAASRRLSETSLW
jgi:putative aldouronate transport system permease protein